MTGRKRRPDLTELADVPTIYIDGSIRYDDGNVVKLLLYTHRASDPNVCDHVATIVLTAAADAVRVEEAIKARALARPDETLN